MVVGRFIDVQELADYRLIVHMVGNGTEAVILGYGGKVALAVVLPQGFIVPHDAFLHVPSVQSGLVHNLVERCAHSDKLLFLGVEFTHSSFA